MQRAYDAGGERVASVPTGVRMVGRSRAGGTAGRNRR
jgi:hypothetical protein